VVRRFRSLVDYCVSGILHMCVCVCSGENMQVMVTYGDWDCDQNKGVHVGMLVA